MQLGDEVLIIYHCNPLFVFLPSITGHSKKAGTDAPPRPTIGKVLNVVLIQISSLWV